MVLEVVEGVAGLEVPEAPGRAAGGVACGAGTGLDWSGSDEARPGRLAEGGEVGHELGVAGVAWRGPARRPRTAAGAAQLGCAQRGPRRGAESGSLPEARPCRTMGYRGAEARSWLEHGALLTAPATAEADPVAGQFEPHPGSISAPPTSLCRTPRAHQGARAGHQSRTARPAVGRAARPHTAPPPQPAAAGAGHRAAG